MADLHGGGAMAAEFQEDEVWAMEAREAAAAVSNSNSRIRKNFSSSSSSSSSSSAWPIPRSATFSGSGTPTHLASAPVSIPHWPKILKNQPKKNTRDDDGSGINFECMMKLDDDDDDGVRLPPHEYLARRLASSQVASFSMCEGVGRTLKGRDLSNLRNTILTKTGFLE